MNWFTLILVFHVLRLNLCVASNQLCPDGQFLNASGICVNCTVCRQPDKNVVIRPCSTHADALCGSVSDININIPGLSKKSIKKIDFTKQFLDINAEAELSKDNISAILHKSSNDKALKDPDDYYDYDEDDYDDEDIKTNEPKIIPNVYTTSKKSKKQNNLSTLKDSFLELASETNKPGKQLKKDLNINTLSPINNTAKSIKYSVFPKPPKYSDEDAKKKSKDSKKPRKKSGDVDRLKIGDTKFVIVNENADDNGRWLRLSHPHIVDEKIYVDLPTEKDKKASTFFSSSEKTSDNYANEMTKLLNETSSVFDIKLSNQTDKDDQDYNTLGNLDDDDDDDEDDSDEDDNDDDDSDDDEDEDDDDDDDYNFIYNDVVNRNASQKLEIEKIDPDIDDEYDLLESENFDEKKWPQHNDANVYYVADPFVTNANWQILILVSAMSACLLFFIVVSAYVCIYMRKRRQFKTNFEADVEDLSVRVNLMQHAGFEADDSSNIKNYITQLRGVKSNNEKLPKICPRKI